MVMAHVSFTTNLLFKFFSKSICMDGLVSQCITNKGETVMIFHTLVFIKITDQVSVINGYEPTLATLHVWLAWTNGEKKKLYQDTYTKPTIIYLET